ncbi:chondroitin sulfate synthase 1, partial [Homo sapiens]
EDVEVGRCVRRFAGVQCVWSYEDKRVRKPLLCNELKRCLSPNGKLSLCSSDGL